MSFTAVLLVCAAGASTERVEELVVTASRVPVPSDRAPVLLDRIDASSIGARGSPFLTDVLRGLPGLAISESGPPGSLSEVRMRGAETNHLLVVVDGIELNDPSTGSLVDFAQLDPAGVQRIEVLRGPQSALWGSDALAGVIALDTRPAPGTRAATLAATSGSLDTYAVAFDAADATRPWYYRATASNIESAGANVATVGGEDDGFRRKHGQLVTGFRGDEWSIDALAGATDSSSEFDPTPFPAFVPRDGDAEVDSTRRVFGLAAESGHSPWHHSARIWRYETTNDAFESHTRTNASNGDKTHLEYQLDRELGRGDVKHRLSAALEHETESFQGEGIASVFGDPNQHQTLDATSAIAEYAAAIGAIDLSLSGRADHNDEFGDATTARVAARYTFESTGTALFALAGTSVKNPTFTERYGFTPDTFIGNPSLDPESGRSVSLGAQQTLADGAWVRAAWFRDRLEDEIDGFAFDASAGGFTAVNRDGTSRRQGVELSGLVPIGLPLSGRYRAEGSLRCDYAYLDATEPAQGREVDEIRRPRHSGGCVADARGGRALLQLGAVYTGTRADSDFATFPATSVTLDGYWLVHAAAAFRLVEWLELTVRVDNAFDDRYQDVFGYDTAGRRMTLGFRATLD